MSQARRWIGAVVAVGATAVVVAACAESTSPEPSGPMLGAVSVASPRFLECHPGRSGGVREMVGGRGGRVAVDGHGMTLPESAVRNATAFTMSVPDSRLVEVNVKANGAEGFAFDAPVSITISYARCPQGAAADEGLTVWKIDPETKAPLKHMGGVQDAVARTVTFVTDSLSSYAIAN